MIGRIAPGWGPPGPFRIDPRLCMQAPPKPETQRLAGSLLGKPGGEGGAKLSMALAFALKFEEGEDPVEVTRGILARAGFASPEDLRDVVRPPRECMVCVPSRNVAPTARYGGEGADIPFLSAALVLGLCTATFYDPARPVLWTTASLTRRVRLFTLGGFYGNS